MNKKHKIQVRRYAEDGTFKVVDEVWRVLKAEQIGNFNPIFVVYGGDKRVLVESDEGDLSDPFRREEAYLKCLYIKLKEKTSVKPKIILQSTNSDVFKVIGLVVQVLLKAGDKEAAKEWIDRANNAQTYSEVLVVAREYVEVN